MGIVGLAMLIIYGADVAVGGGGAGDGFLPLDGMARGIGLGLPPVILAFAAFFITRHEESVPLGVIILAVGVLIIAGGIHSIANADAESMSRAMGEGGSLIGVGAIITVLGGIKIKKSIA
ncbi:MAG: hypothetical protein F4Y82_02940 [Cenarchaeum sp. SB0665_bin_23]|nr:hypothetical protein [Cenarchaeum sp. SB0667_bin_13]MXY61056.1 hypothetical protein [Cenarchaeum sp. SB0665_bin_23]MXZ94272.1 hypothetical protein [Cenarchaeum sp. SB0666_bin_15]MYB46829.1 hypothetical protein [Cenarchaeum sp. SB0662_bin_33]MYC79302.1 hypothetical protein [Cenarchaeum sp. SB0661_bin_35]MYD58570.1 hypothetical protein [Cenarchaeum sp. SB0678_bin_8]MYG33065.1 hypothetical protein [Cenarchaeum sp. SB0677_bin_16]MYI52061.1 hypothetical protein [Cenarchaeum sp. SB0673_bin_9]M